MRRDERIEGETETARSRSHPLTSSVHPQEKVSDFLLPGRFLSFLMRTSSSLTEAWPCLQIPLPAIVHLVNRSFSSYDEVSWDGMR